VKILWAQTVRGSWIPLDCNQDPKGNCFFNDAGFVIVVQPGVNIDKGIAGSGYLSHFVSCPNAEAHRKK